MLDVLREICNRLWRIGEWPTPWTQGGGSGSAMVLGKLPVPGRPTI